MYDVTEAEGIIGVIADVCVWCINMMLVINTEAIFLIIVLRLSVSNRNCILVGAAFAWTIFLCTYLELIFHLVICLVQVSLFYVIILTPLLNRPNHVLAYQNWMKFVLFKIYFICEQQTCSDIFIYFLQNYASVIANFITIQAESLLFQESLLSIPNLHFLYRPIRCKCMLIGWDGSNSPFLTQLRAAIRCDLEAGALQAISFEKRH